MSLQLAQKPFSAQEAGEGGLCFIDVGEGSERGLSSAKRVIFLC